MGDDIGAERGQVGRVGSLGMWPAAARSWGTAAAAPRPLTAAAPAATPRAVPAMNLRRESQPWETLSPRWGWGRAESPGSGS